MPVSESEYMQDAGLLRDPGSMDGRIRQRKQDWRSWGCRFGRGQIRNQKYGGGAATGATGDKNQLLIISGGQVLALEQFILGAGETIITPVQGTYGMNVALDLTNNEGAEYIVGENAIGPSFKIGTDPAFFARITLYIADVSGSDETFLGFRKVQTYDAAIATYTDKALIGNVNGDIKLMTLLNNAGGVVTDTTDNWADGEVHTLGVYVSAAGVVTYKLDDHDPTAVAAFTFDDGDEVVPMFRMLHDVTSPGAVEVIAYEGGLQTASPKWPGPTAKLAL